MLLHDLINLLNRKINCTDVQFWPGFCPLTFLILTFYDVVSNEFRLTIDQNEREIYYEYIYKTRKNKMLR